MRALLIIPLALALLAGCSTTPPSPPSVPVADAAEVIVEEPVGFHLTSPVWICKVGCAGVNGPATMDFHEHAYVGFSVQVAPTELPEPGMPLPLSQVRIVAECTGHVATCPEGALAQTEGPWPATLEAKGFRTGEGEALVFRLEYLGPAPAPANGSAGSYDFTGTLQHVQDDNATADGDATSP